MIQRGWNRPYPLCEKPPSFVSLGCALTSKWVQGNATMAMPQRSRRLRYLCANSNSISVTHDSAGSGGERRATPCPSIFADITPPHTHK
eukprot:scaffold20132_cov144-Skeletonema_dohrnii-CCMP3373.AAC.1